MSNSERLAEFELSNNYRRKFTYLQNQRSVYLELQKPTNQKDGHGYSWAAGLTLSGADLQQFITAIAALQEPPLTA